jgi:hypothetical protein
MKRNYKYDLPEGTVYVTIRPADVKEEYHPDGPAKGKVTRHVPFVVVSTRPRFSEDGRFYLPDEPEGYLIIGTNRYRVEDNYRLTTPAEQDAWTRPDGPQPWTTSGVSSPWEGGIRRESGSRVDFDAPVLKKINPVIMRALKQFDEEVPDWNFRSIALLLEQEADHKGRQVADANAALLKAEEEHSKAIQALKDYRAQMRLESADV